MKGWNEMKRITVCSSKTYDVIVDEGIINNAGYYVKGITKGDKIAVISDSNVWPIYGNQLLCSLKNTGYDIISYIIPAGELSKNGSHYLEILNFLAENQLTRKDSIIALGGGVVGDLAGFIAATYLRGISLVQIPTSLLAMVDSSVGGKTAINLPSGKNLAGAFYHPALVLCDLQALKSLPEDIFLEGCAEIIKYSILFDEELFNHLNQKGRFFDRGYVIPRCIELKRDVVARDELDFAERQLLNLGHTLGHSIEANSNYTIPHGKAVAIGISLITACSVAAEVCEEDLFSEICGILTKFSLPTTTSYDVNSLAGAALRDKKRGNSALTFILPHAIGKCAIHTYSIEELETFIKAGLCYADHHISG